MELSNCENATINADDDIRPDTASTISCDEDGQNGNKYTRNIQQTFNTDMPTRTMPCIDLSYLQNNTKVDTPTIFSLHTLLANQFGTSGHFVVPHLPSEILQQMCR